jgi:hypothetical protein
MPFPADLPVIGPRRGYVARRFLNPPSIVLPELGLPQVPARDSDRGVPPEEDIGLVLEILPELLRQDISQPVARHGSLYWPFLTA